ncbi:MAG: hypothetical protein ACLGH3_02705 [Actinomycetota bacterium]
MDKIAIILQVLTTLSGGVARRVRGTWGRLREEDDGQAVTEYTLVILVAASVALLLLNWVQGGALTTFFNDIFSQVTGMFSGGA